MPNFLWEDGSRSFHGSSAGFAQGSCLRNTRTQLEALFFKPLELPSRFQDGFLAMNPLKHFLANPQPVSLLHFIHHYNQKNKTLPNTL